MKINKIKKASLAMIFLVILFVVFSFNQDRGGFLQEKAIAGNEHNLSGYAWSDNVGWINFNCLDEDTCGTVNYGVTVGSNNELSGYAWNDNIGWISFNESDLSGCPEGACKAKLLGTSLEGWAKALSANENGWDGWISLAKQPAGKVSYGVTLNSSKFEGYAWGSDVIGWIDFSSGEYEGVSFGAYPHIAQFNVESVVNGDSPTISWETTNSSSCEGSWATGDLCSDVADCASGSDSGGAVNTETTYTITCYGSGGEISESKTQSSYYKLKFVDTYPDNIAVEFVVSGATTTKTKVGVVPWDGFTGNITLNASLNSTIPEALPVGSFAIYSNQILSPAEYSIGSDFSIFVSGTINGAHTVPITGSAGILGDLSLIINAKGLTPKWEEI